MNINIELPVAKIILEIADADCFVNWDLAEEIREACRAISETENIRLLLITISGKSSGAWAGEMPKEPVSRPLDNRLSSLAQHRVADSVAALAVPVVVAISGDALDHALELALAADLRIARSDTRFGLTHLNRGTLPWDGGIQRLTRLVGPGWTRDLLLTSRVIDAGQALAIGLVNQVAEPDNFDRTVQELVERIIASGPIAASFVKEAVNQGMDLTLEQGLRLETDLNVILHSTSDRQEGLRSFTERRAPKFSGS